MAEEKLEEQVEEQVEEQKEERKPELKYTDDDVNVIVEKRLARERDKWDKQAEALKRQASEAEKLKSMNEVERAQHESEVFRKENEELKRRLSIVEQMDIAREELSNANIRMGDELLSTFITDNADTNKKTLDSIKTLWPVAVDAAVKEELKRTPPRNPNEKPSSAPSAGKAFAEKYNKRMKGEE